MVASLWTYLHSTPPLTWIGHALQGFLWGVASDAFAFSTWLAAFVLLYHFGVREVEGIVEAYLDNHRSALVDGVMDLATPFLGLLTYILIR